MGAECLTEVFDKSEEVVFWTEAGNPLRIGDEVFFFGVNTQEKKLCLYSFDLSTKRLTAKAHVSMPSSSLF
jgi:hypothetical protein